MSRFDQRDLATNPYGKCKDCDLSIATEGDSMQHMLDARHAVWVLNPSRERNLERHVSSEFEMALDDIFQGLYQLVEDGEATADEIEKALTSVCFVDDQWRRYVGDPE